VAAENRDKAASVFMPRDIVSLFESWRPFRDLISFAI